MAFTAALSWIGLYTGRGAGHVPALWWADSVLVSILLLSRRKQPLWLLAAGRRIRRKSDWPSFASRLRLADASAFRCRQRPLSGQENGRDCIHTVSMDPLPTRHRPLIVSATQ
jgi:hypothetical protein